MSTAGKPDPEYVKARRVLLDALSSLSVHSDALVLVGAHAICLRVGAGELAVAPYTRSHEAGPRSVLRLFGAEDGTGVEMVVRATEGLDDPAIIRPSCTVLVADLLEAVRGGVGSVDPEDPG